MPFDPRTFAVDRVLRDGGSIHVRAIRPRRQAAAARSLRRASARARSTSASSASRRSSPRTSCASSPSSTSRAAWRWWRRCGAAPRSRSSASAVTSAWTCRPASRRAPRSRSRSPTTTRGAASARCCSSTWRRSRAPNGIEEFEADVLGENNRMLAVFAQSGYRGPAHHRCGHLSRHLSDRGDRRIARRAAPARARRGRGQRRGVPAAALGGGGRRLAARRLDRRGADPQRPALRVSRTHLSGASECGRDRRAARLSLRDARSASRSTSRSSPCRPRRSSRSWRNARASACAAWW